MKGANKVALLSVLNAFSVVDAAPTTPGVRAVAPLGDAEFHPARDQFSAQFIGGHAVSVKDYPFVIAGLRSGGSRPQGQTCTGSVIGPRKILIAAHCVDAEGTKTFAYGLDDLNNGTLHKIPVSSYIKHPNYVNFDQGWDVAVATTTEDIPVDGGQYAKFATSADSGIAAAGKKAYALGYGKKDVNDNSRNVQLHRGDLPIVAPATCDQTGQGLHVVPEYMICSGYSSGRPVTILPGDSGGPLVVDGKVVGVGSWSKSTWNWYSIYSRLDNEMGDWVAEQLNA
ncbi:hypothetical protein VHEMI10388 [[Torrubiella] hemipterigena]|uniref:Peptidase S1 domain-containing protein n=1 Tax=[Torrubiella] hemipterigena TaxID=1531966 RepID=A0A0A1TCV7_9HYPO|nr:hypothetical protein VHEMI10388 [[Torrubiella] hemipterigena]